MEQAEGEGFDNLSPETGALLQSLPDTPRSLELKAEYLRKVNELQRGEGRVFEVRKFMKGFWLSWEKLSLKASSLHTNRGRWSALSTAILPAGVSKSLYIPRVSKLDQDPEPESIRSDHYHTYV